MSLNKSEINTRGDRYISNTTNTIIADLDQAELDIIQNANDIVQNANDIVSNDGDIKALQDNLSETTLNGTFANNTAVTPAVNLLISKYSKQVSVTIPSAIATSGAFGNIFFIFSAVLPLEYRPSQTLYFYASIQNNSVSAQGEIAINTSGQILIYADPAHVADFTSLNAGVNSCGISYTIA